MIPVPSPQAAAVAGALAAAAARVGRRRVACAATEPEVVEAGLETVGCGEFASELCYLDDRLT